MEETAFDPRRRLCPDGSCVGIIGADGRCSVCERPPGAVAQAVTAEDDDDRDVGATAAAEPSDEALAAGSSVSGFNPARRLCDDGSCVGVVGADGACSTCGRKAD